MEFEWDEQKRQTVIKTRSVDILYAALIFRGDVVTYRDGRPYSEERFISIGMVNEDCFVVVHTSRTGKTRLITAWKGGRNERKHYQDSIAARHRGDE